jgi:DNA-binding IclR family transcriptional regulator
MIQSVLKAIDIMNVFSPAEPFLTLRQISERVNMPKSTVHNMLNTLASRRFIEQLSDDRYALGTGIVPLTQAVWVNAELRDRAAPLTRELADVVKESVYLTYLDGDFVLYIYAVETPSRLRARTAVGDRIHPHCTAVGKAILAALPTQQVEGIVERIGLPRFTENTITALDTLLRELEQTRKRGYSVDNQEHEKGIFCLGAVIRDSHGKPIGACSVSGLDPEIIGERADKLSAELLHVVQEISSRMGYIVATPSLLVPLATEQSPLT